uniref:HAT C-terminal dimerisation domain-containing protein n=1 Tax=Lactuca sativa TaxID=4236 RepID=A0A9R1W1W1_LACSA|nr:hypothetical protein LSAT_V11C300139100 [Lactuca sativa]
MQYSPNFENLTSVKIGLYMCLERMCPCDNLTTMIDLKFDQFTNARGLFGLKLAKNTRKEKSLIAEKTELREFAIKILSLTCSPSGCERYWSAFEVVHSKRRNQLHQKKDERSCVSDLQREIDGKRTKLREKASDNRT